MARNRMIKPSFWTSEQIVECSMNARLLFIGIWNFCDDAGIHPASPKTIKMEVFPGDDFQIEDIIDMLNELLMQELIIHYVVDGKGYFQVTGWNHQKIDRPSYVYPSIEKSENGSEPFDYYSTNDRRALALKGKEEKRSKRNKHTVGKPENHDEKDFGDSDESPECEKTDEQQSRKSKTRQDEFNQVWETLSADWHGNPGSKAEALKAYQKIKPDEETLQAIYAGHLKQIQAHHKLAQAGQFSPKFKHVCRWLTLECWNDIPAEPDHDQEQPAKANGHPYANTRAYQVTLKRAQETGEVQMIEFRGLPTFVSPSGAVS